MSLLGTAQQWRVWCCRDTRACLPKPSLLMQSAGAAWTSRAWPRTITGVASVTGNCSDFAVNSVLTQETRFSPVLSLLAKEAHG